MARRPGLGRAADGTRAPQGATDSGEDVAAHHGLVKMIPQWERGGRAPRERYRLLYLKVFAKLGISSRRELRQALAAAAQAGP